MGPVRQNPIQRTVSLFICVCIALCTIVAHDIAQNRPDNNFPPYPPDNHHISDDVYLREGGKMVSRFCGCHPTTTKFSKQTSSRMAHKNQQRVITLYETSKLTRLYPPMLATRRNKWNRSRSELANVGARLIGVPRSSINLYSCATNLSRLSSTAGSLSDNWTETMHNHHTVLLLNRA